MKHILTALAALACTTAHASDYADSKTICQQFVADTLKAPATARFEPTDTVMAAINPDKKYRHLSFVWDTMGYVDSQNSFGALIRSKYICTVQRTGPDDWRLLNIMWVKGRAG